MGRIVTDVRARVVVVALLAVLVAPADACQDVLVIARMDVLVAMGIALGDAQMDVRVRA